ncbi:glucose-1-phosphate cytidylyltransferase [soil metagenome]
MKVVLFCGGLGTRLRDYSEDIPKPMVEIGYRPILWHIMKYYAHFGHTEFILCLGYKGDVIKNYFLNYDECVSNDFVMTDGGRDVHLLASDIDDWKITFVDTGAAASIGERLKAVESHIGDDDVFMANYSDGLTDLWLPDHLEHFESTGAIASFLAVHSPQSFHVASIDDDGHVSGINPLSESNLWINGGFFLFRREMFSYMHDGEDIVYEPFARLIAERRLVSHRYRGFWMPMDTFKEKQALDRLYSQGHAPWQVWKAPREASNQLSNS